MTDKYQKLTIGTITVPGTKQIEGFIMIHPVSVIPNNYYLIPIHEYEKQVSNYEKKIGELEAQLLSLYKNDD